VPSTLLTADIGLPPRLRVVGGDDDWSSGGGRADVARTSLRVQDRPTMRWLRVSPWLLAIAGLVGLFIQLSEQTPEWLWLVAAWSLLIGFAWLLGRATKPTSNQRMAAALVFLIVLVLLSWWGGFYLIPADLAWLIVEGVDRDSDQRRIGPIA
jgi:hypothetical protein